MSTLSTPAFAMGSPRPQGSRFKGAESASTGRIISAFDAAGASADQNAASNVNYCLASTTVHKRGSARWAVSSDRNLWSSFGCDTGYKLGS
jgi:hypothetical protein